MAGYQTPGILVTEVDTPNTATVLDQPTVVGIVGLARGHQEQNQIKYLLDSDPVELTGTNIKTSPASTFVVRDINRLNTVYTQGSDKDYTLTTDVNGVTSIRRSLYTTISSTESVVAVIKTTSPSGVVTNDISFSYDNETGVVTPSNGGTISTSGDAPSGSNISIQRAGAYVVGTDYEVNLSNGRIRRAAADFGANPGDCHIMSSQTVYVSYTTTGGLNTYTDEVVVLTGQTYATLLHEVDGIDTDSIVVCNALNLSSGTSNVAVFTAGINGNPGVDFQFSFSPSAAAATSFTMMRNIDGPTMIGLDRNAANVRVGYQYIDTNYYVPTLFSSYHELENKFGPAFDSHGNVISPLSAAAYMCFRSGSNQIVAQALYAADADGVRVQGTESNPNHWAVTLGALRDQGAINVLVPAVGQNSNITDDTIAAIQIKFVDHINEMSQNNEYVIAIFGEDSTNDGTSLTGKASNDTLQQHAKILSQQALSERTVLVSPSAFKISNPVTGKMSVIGGQYIAASIAGMLAGSPVQSSVTRRSIPGINDVAVYRTEAEKINDSTVGLMVVESKNGVVRVRHAITTAVNDDNKRELNAMRSKFYMIESISKTLDENIIGRVLTDARAPFIVGTSVTKVLEYLKNSGAITNYSGVTATISTTSATSMTIRFSYSLPYAINNIEVAIALDTITGTFNAQ